MSKIRRLIEKAFYGRGNLFGRIVLRSATAVSPNGVVTAPKGTLLIMDYYGNAVDGDVYINTDGTTAWTIIHNNVA